MLALGAYGAAFDGGFLLRHWAPVAVMVLFAVAVLGPGRAPRPLLVAIWAGWGFAAYSVLSATWATMPSQALQGGVRTALYVGLLTLALVGLTDRRSAREAATTLLVALGGLAFLILLLLLVGDGTSLMLAGRLNEPIGYRNGTAALFATAAVGLLCVAGARDLRPALRGLAFSAAVTALGLAFLTQSRGVLAAAALGVVVAVALGPDRLRRTWSAIVAVGFVAVMSGGLLEPYDVFLADRITDADATFRAARTLLVGAILAFLLMFLVAVLDRGLRGDEIARRARRTSVALLAVGALVGVAGGLAATGDPVSFVDRKVSEFTNLEQTAQTGSTRIGSVSGQRYDLWRVAWREFVDHPLVGVGEGSYRTGYYARRATDRNLTSAHSLPLGVAAELGLVGIGLAVAALVALLVPIVRRLRDLDRDDRRVASAMIAVAAVVVGQSLVDWTWTIPLLGGTAMLALGVAGALAFRRPGAPRPERSPRVVTVGLRVVASVTVAVAVALYLGTAYVREARDARIAGDAAAQLDAARDAQRLLRWDPEPRWLEAGALEALDRPDDARAALREAIDLEPEHFVGHVLLGDLELRLGRPDDARRAYRAALRLNPRDAGLRELAGR
ncbi:MAG: O-antigen ligase family protein [Solirubrobacteraceae bacterium]|nr:O-antigen ligase family protein [Solirubrobacteraceae bacterium]